MDIQTSYRFESWCMFCLTRCCSYMRDIIHMCLCICQRGLRQALRDAYQRVVVLEDALVRHASRLNTVRCDGRYGTISYSTTRYDTVLYGIFDTVRHGTTRYDTVWYYTVRNSMVRYGTTWYDTVRYRTIYDTGLHGAWMAVWTSA